MRKAEVIDASAAGMEGIYLSIVWDLELCALLLKSVEKSLKRLKLERIDLYQLHTVDPKLPIEDS
jgi:diketogulonate reductase-like aldo/keto reductase